MRRAAARTPACQVCRAGSRTTTTRLRPRARLRDDARGRRRRSPAEPRVAGTSARNGSASDQGSSPEAMPARRPALDHQRAVQPRQPAEDLEAARAEAASTAGSPPTAGSPHRVSSAVRRAASCSRSSAQPPRPDRVGDGRGDLLDQSRVVLRAGLDRIGAGDQSLDEPLDHPERCPTPRASRGRP